MRFGSGRILTIDRHLSRSTTARAQLHGMASKMAAEKFDITTRYKMNSGFEIPVLGYGVCHSFYVQLIPADDCPLENQNTLALFCAY